MGSGLTAEQRKICLAELRAVHARDVGQCRSGLVTFAYWPILTFLSWTIAGSKPLDPTAVPMRLGY